MVLALAVGGLTQWYVNSSFKKNSETALPTGLTGAAVARRVLDSEGLVHVRIERVAGQLTDHFDPRSNVLRLSQAVHDGAHVSAAGVAAHEAGHAVQHARGYVPARLRGGLVPAAQFGSNLAWPLIFFGAFLSVTPLVWAGVAMFAAAVFFQIVTLPVEFDASKRALAALTTTGSVYPGQADGARQVLTAAALTYIAATLVSVLYLLHFIGIARR
jgi:hypothetical protein